MADRGFPLIAPAAAGLCLEDMDNHASPEKAAPAALLLANLAKVRSLRSSTVLTPQQAQVRMRLRAWQAGRFPRSYPDLLASARYRPAAEFFLSDLYGPTDFSKRDEELERIVPVLTKILPDAAVHTLAVAVELDALSESLDAAMVGALHLALKGAAGEISERSYAAAYRACANREAREKQIVLIVQIGQALDRLTRKALAVSALHLLKKPAQISGLAELHDFLDRGFGAFRHMKGADEFLDIIHGRETRIMDNLFAGRERPFDTGKA